MRDQPALLRLASIVEGLNARLERLEQDAPPRAVRVDADAKEDFKAAAERADKFRLALLDVMDALKSANLADKHIPVHLPHASLSVWRNAYSKADEIRGEAFK